MSKIIFLYYAGLLLSLVHVFLLYIFEHIGYIFVITLLMSLPDKSTICVISLAASIDLVISFFSFLHAQ